MVLSPENRPVREDLEERESPPLSFQLIPEVVNGEFASEEDSIPNEYELLSQDSEEYELSTQEATDSYDQTNENPGTQEETDLDVQNEMNNGPDNMIDENREWDNKEGLPERSTIALDQNHIESIKNCMANIALPSSAIPSWAAHIPEEQLTEFIYSKLSSHDPKNNKMSATFYGKQEELPSVEQCWSDEEDEDLSSSLSTASAGEPKLQVTADVQKVKHVYISFLSVFAEATCPQVGEVTHQHLHGPLLLLKPDSVWFRMEPLRGPNRASDTRHVTSLLRQTRTHFGNCQFHLLVRQSNYDLPFQWFENVELQITSGQTKPQSHPVLHLTKHSAVLEQYRCEPPYVLRTAENAATFEYCVQEQLPIFVYLLPLINQLAEMNLGDLLPDQITKTLWSSTQSYLHASSNLYA